jgi:hypothetical protein
MVGAAVSDQPNAQLTPVQTARLAKAPIGSLGGMWMTDPAEEELTATLGLAGWQLYFLARHAPLGDVDPDVVLAGAYFFPRDYLRREWLTARASLTPAEALEPYLAMCHAWGRTHLAGFAATDRLTELTRRVIDGADVAGLPLFAGWRALEVPADPAVRLGHLMQVMREYHGAVHGVAVVSSGLSPLMAVLANQGGQQNAIDYGWEPPFPPVSAQDRAAREQVEDLTDRLAARAYQALTPGERGELVGLLDAALAHAQA